MLRRPHKTTRNPCYNFSMDGVMLGWFSLELHNYDGSGTAKVWAVGIREEFQGYGYGKAMMRDLVKLCRRIKGVKRIWLQVNAKNEPAKACYRHAGFTLKQVDTGMMEGMIEL